MSRNEYYQFYFSKSGKNSSSNLFLCVKKYSKRVPSLFIFNIFFSIHASIRLKNDDQTKRLNLLGESSW